MITLLSLEVISLALTVLHLVFYSHLEFFSAKVTQALQVVPLSFLMLFLAFATEAVYFVVSAYVYIFRNRYIGMLGLTGTCFGASLASTLKLCFTEPRPFWVFTFIQGIGCNKGFGTPSGHCLSASGCISSVWSECDQKWTKYAMASALGVTILNRVYLGVHSIDQVVLGSFYGLTLGAFLNTQVVRKAVFEMSNDLRKMLTFQGVIVTMLFVALMIYEFNQPNWQQVWNQNYEAHCGGQISKNITFTKNYLETTLLFMLSGFILGYHLLGTQMIPKPSAKLYLFSLSLILGLLLVVFGAYQLFNYIFPNSYIYLPLGVLNFATGISLSYLVPKAVIQKYPMAHVKASHFSSFELNSL